jgi:hypothetical protein
MMHNGQCCNFIVIDVWGRLVSRLVVTSTFYGVILFLWPHWDSLSPYIHSDWWNVTEHVSH